MQMTIATIASHSCLQILKGAKDEGFLTLAITKPEGAQFYQLYPFIDAVVTPEEFSRSDTANVILIPHGSFVAYGMLNSHSEALAEESREDARTGSFTSFRMTPIFGNKKILEIEADRQVQHEWMMAAGVRVPKIFASSDDVDRPVIIKYFGARGGQGYQVAANKKEIEKILKRHSGPSAMSSGQSNCLPGISSEKLLHSDPGQARMTQEKYILQEYIIGTPVYCQYFYSVARQRLEIMGFDRRYETDVDGIGRVPAALQQKIDVQPTFTVIGNLPLVVRESLLPQFYDMGQRVIEAAKKLTPQGLWGPFCLETIITPDQKITVIEISARIVAGTNLYINGSPYSDLLFDEPMSTGRRIAREIKEAGEKEKLQDVIT